uniref:Transcription factor n=1 Tax=Solanum tuberosum TaxID=4113 RepID=M1BMQ1_SOLTU
MSDNPQPQPPLQSPSPPQGYPRGPLSYPKPEAEYHEIVQNSQLFWNKLQQFSASLQTNFQIPLVAGTPLDLHRLFVEVTSRGGIEKGANWEEYRKGIEEEKTRRRAKDQCCEKRSPRRQWQEARRGDPSSPFTFVARRSSKGDAMTTKGERQEARKARKASPFVFSLKKGDQFRGFKSLKGNFRVFD